MRNSAVFIFFFWLITTFVVNFFRSIPLHLMPNALLVFCLSFFHCLQSLILFSVIFSSLISQSLLRNECEGIFLQSKEMTQNKEENKQTN